MNYLGYTVWELSNEWQKKLLQKLSKIDVTHVQFLILKAVYELEVNHEEKTQIRVSKKAKTNIMMTSKVIRALILKELLVRQQHEGDKRAYRIAITKEGKKTLQKAINIVETFDENFFKSVDKKKRLTKDLKKIIKKNK